MSREYAPDRWEIVKINYNGDVVYKVLGSWYGGYAGSDSWRLSSGITAIDESDTCFTVKNESGSTYTCYKGGQGMSGYTHSIFNSLKSQETETVKIDIVEIKNVVLNETP